MDILIVKDIIEGFKKMDIEELNTRFDTLCKLKKEKEKEYNDLVEQVYFIISELKKEIELKSSLCDSDDETSDEEYKLDVRLIDVCSDEE
jgi:hypothetical protein